MSLIFGIFGKKLILKHFMHRTIPKSVFYEYFEPHNTFLRSILLEEGSFLHFDIFLRV